MDRLNDSLIAQILKNLSGSRPNATCSTSVATLEALAREVRDRRAAEVPPSPLPGTRLAWRPIPGDDYGRFTSEIDGSLFTLWPPERDGEPWVLDRASSFTKVRFEAPDQYFAELAAADVLRASANTILAATQHPSHETFDEAIQRAYESGYEAGSTAPDARAQEGARP
jgi:hypothetical protein